MATSNSVSMNIVEFINNTIKGGQFGWSMVTITIPRMRKTSNPYFGRVQKVTLTTNCLFGLNYGAACTKKATALAEGEKYQEEKPKGKSWVKYPYILSKDTDPSVEYLRVSYFPTRSATTSIYLLDERMATPQEVADIKTFVQGGKPTPKQTEAGIADDEQVIVRDYDLSHIAIIKQGTKEWNNTSLPFELIKTLFIK